VRLGLKESGAAALVSAGCGLTARLQSRGADLVRSRSLQTQCLASRAKLQLAGGALGEALETSRQALASARAERSGDTAADRYSVARAYQLLGDVRQRMGDAEAAKRAWTTGLAQLPPRIAERPPEASTRASLLRRLNREDEARPLVARLAAMGYRNAS